MTKPTGRPRGRPKTKNYSTLMARVPQELADRVKQYAARHRFPISDLIRDGLEWRLQEDDDILAYRYVPVALPRDDIVSDMNMDSKEPAVSDVKEDVLYRIVSDTKEEEPAPAFDRRKYYLSTSCKYGHASHGSQNLRELVGGACVACKAAKKAAKREAAQASGG